MFGSFIEFKWNPTTHKLTLLQRPVKKSYIYGMTTKLEDYLAKQWIKDYTLAVRKYMLGETLVNLQLLLDLKVADN